MDTLQDYFNEMDKLYNEFCESVDDFIISRTINNKKKVVEKSRKFCNIKNKVTLKVRDTNCKGEQR